MTVLREWELLIDADHVLSGQGAKPAVVRKRSPYLVDMAERAIVEGKSLIKPALLYRRIPVESILHERILLEGRDELKSRLLRFKGNFKFDFTESYLDGLSTDKLKHILLAAVTTKFKKGA